jgi:hypothetical protein
MFLHKPLLYILPFNLVLWLVKKWGMDFPFPEELSDTSKKWDSKLWVSKNLVICRKDQ